jgi:hypothetical protein
MTLTRNEIILAIYPDGKIPISDASKWPEISHAIDNLALAMSREDNRPVHQNALNQYDPMSKKVTARIIELRESQERIDWVAIANQINEEFNILPYITVNACKKRYYQRHAPKETPKEEPPLGKTDRKWQPWEIRNEIARLADANAQCFLDGKPDMHLVHEQLRKAGIDLKYAQVTARWRDILADRKKLEDMRSVEAIQSLG